MAARKKKKLDINPNVLFYGGLAVAAYFAIVKPVLQTVGIMDTPEEKADEKLNIKIDNLNEWGPDVYPVLQFAYGKKADEAKAQHLAREIYASWGWLNDDELRIYGAFRSLSSLYELSALSYFYYKKYNQDLLIRLRNEWFNFSDGLSEAEFSKIAKIVNALPKK